MRAPCVLLLISPSNEQNLFLRVVGRCVRPCERSREPSLSRRRAAVPPCRRRASFVPADEHPGRSPQAPRGARGLGLPSPTWQVPGTGSPQVLAREDVKLEAGLEVLAQKRLYSSRGKLLAFRHLKPNMSVYEVAANRHFLWPPSASQSVEVFPPAKGPSSTSILGSSQGLSRTRTRHSAC